MSKEEIVSALNEFFGIKLRWDKMPKEDLQRLYDFLNKPENLIRRLIDVMGYEEFVKTTNNTILHKIVDERPLRRTLKELLLGAER